MKRFQAIALDTYQYDEYPTPNWIKGQCYDATDDGYMLTLSSETGNFYFTGKAREGIWNMFRFEQVGEEKVCIYCGSGEVYVRGLDGSWVCADCLAELEPIEGDSQ